MRRLPPSWTLETFLSHVDPLPAHDYLHFVPADHSLGPHAFSRAYLNLTGGAGALQLFTNKWDDYVFLDEQRGAGGGEYPAVVEFAPFLKVPKKRNKNPDARINTIESGEGEGLQGVWDGWGLGS